MARKRSSIKRKGNQNKKQSDTTPPTIPDRRGMEKTMADLGRILSQQKFDSIDDINAFMENLMKSGQPIDMPGDTPLDQAQELMYQAWDAQGAQRIQIARRALTLSEDCADAYVLLAEESAKTINEAKTLYEQGVAAGERAIGAERFEEDAGHFWGMIETRPYMRARAGLAECLYLMGQREEAAAHYKDMIRLNPGDNQGIRYQLVNILLEFEDYAALVALFEQYPEDPTAAMAYPQALALFKQEGESEAAVKQLEEAISWNQYVPSYLLGKRRIPKQLPEYMSLGSKEEAVAYVVDAQFTWEQNPDALDWLRRTYKKQIGN